MRFKKLRHRLTYAALLLVVPTSAAFAQSSVGLEEIVVTARQRQENLTDIPLAITTLTAASIEQSQIRDMSELAKFTPGFTYRQQNTGNGGRILPSYRFRGMNAGVGGSLSQLGAVFVDGLYLLGGAQSMTFEDVERVEVIKGPQSAYFGRSTFGGAINFITREPKDEYSARVGMSAESYGGRNFSLSAEGPIIREKLLFRVSGESNQIGAGYTASDGGKIGRQRTDTINATLVAKPIDGLTVRVRYTHAVDDDSHPAFVDLNASKPNIEGSSAECLRGTLKYWCGELPKMGDPGVPKSVIDTSTSFITPSFARSNLPNIIPDILNFNRANPRVTRDYPLHDQLPDLDHMGLHGKFDWITADLSYDFGDGYNFRAAFGDSTSKITSAGSSMVDGAAANVIPVMWENIEGEMRISSPQDQRLTWLIGANVFRQAELGQPTGGLSVRVDVNNNIVYNIPAFYASQNKVNYWGIFAGAHYSILDNLKLDLEGRFQRDKVTNAFQTTSETSQSFNAFAPRVILTYHPMQDMTVYGSWARGVNPGFNNAAFALLSPAMAATVRADPGFVERTGAETLDSFEIGLKQQIDWLRYAVAIYYGKWNNLKNQVAFACPGNICGPGFVANFATLFTVRQGTLKGLEAEVNAAITDNWDVDATLELIGSRFNSFASPTAFAGTGLTQGTNLKIFEYPVASASLSSTYRIPINDELTWYVRGEGTYTGKTYVDEFNQAWIGAAYNLNLRTGVSGQGKRIEAYVTNVFDQNQWVGGRRGSSVIDPRPAVSTQYPTAFLTAPRKRAMGIRASYEF